MHIINTATGETTWDTSYSSDWLAIPTDITLPGPLKKLAKEYETAWNSWSEEASTLETDAAELETAEAADTLALVTAVSKGEPNPGHPNRDTANEKYRYQAEVTRQAAHRANQLHDKVWASMIENKNELIANAVQLERDAITQSVQLFSEARNLADKAEEETRMIGSRINFIASITNTSTSIGRSIDPYIPTVSWPEQYRIEQPTALVFLDLITGEKEPQPAEALVEQMIPTT